MQVAAGFDHRGCHLREAVLGARFDGGERYVERLRKVEAMEKEMKDGHVTTA